MNNLMFTIELTSKCNLKCLHCLREQRLHGKDLPFSLFKKIIGQAKLYNKPYVALTGGEPTLHKDFVKILSFLSDEGFDFHFVTNGYNFASIFPRIDRFLGKGLKRICFSLDGANEATHDKIRTKSSYRRTMEAIALCKAKGIPISVQMVVNKLNRHEIRDMANIGALMGLENLYFCHMQPAFGNATYDISLPPEEWHRLEDEIAELKATFNVPIRISAGHFDMTPLSHCQFLQGNAINIDFNGNLTFCCQLSGMFDGSKKKDIICNLSKISLFKGHKMLIDRIAHVNKQRIDSISKGKVSKLDFFHCWFCFKQFEKIGWMKTLKNNPWRKAEPHFNPGARKKWQGIKELSN